MSFAPKRRIVTAAVVAALGAAPAFALAATKNGVTPTSPKPGAVVAKGKSVKFKGKVRGTGRIFVHVCKSAKRSEKGIICRKASIGQAKRRSKAFSYSQPTYAFKEHWLNTPGTYYWQAYRIACENGNTSDCNQEGPVVKFRVR